MEGATSDTPMLDEFLGNIYNFVITRDSNSLADWLQVDAPLSGPYGALQHELSDTYWEENNALEERLAASLPESDEVRDDQGNVWPGFLVFIKDYLEYWRDVNFDNAVEAQELLATLIKYALSAF
jgi:hypothetical protein